MRKPKRFRPAMGDALEERTVPSGFDGGLGNLIGSLPATDAQAVRQAFDTFETSYTHDVMKILVPSGTTTPASNRAAFDAQVATDLNTLNTAIDTAIGNLPTATTLEATIQAELLTPATTTTTTTTSPLQTQLSAIASPTAVNWRALRTFFWQSYNAIGQTDNQVTKQVQSAPAPTGSIDVATFQTAMGSVTTAYWSFISTYNGDVTTILYASTGTPATNRAAFDTALQKLNTDITTGLNTGFNAIASPAQPALSNMLTALSTTIQNDLLTPTTTTTTTSTSLQSSLAALTTPKNHSWFGNWAFRSRSFWTISTSYYHVFNDIAAAVKTYNTAL
jgi:hypothetical protein